ncbi:hypothetical protein FB567DRAFT_550323 [Paraphoma chrysanthemicola]|uniref:Uncharacterized protein n=1 Tax=Paraphoma chrysanthemicola TaxID=798071 RepID=A0A8K0R2S9_9PLEO|nr:hypothetical protein FB567DRAFT_550323 [Paraphoma chrysanthemicola]
MAAPINHDIGTSAQVSLLQTQSTPAIKPPRLSNHRLFEDAPPEDLQFAQTGTFTAAEIVTFFPKALESHDIVHRLASNGMSNQIVADIINYHRVASFKGSVTNTALCHTMQKAMRDGMVLRGQTVSDTELIDADDEEDKKAWSKKLHEKLDLKNKDGPWDHNNLTLAGCYPQSFYRDQTFVAKIPFKSLARGVDRFPSVQRGDGADLTRCVQYAVAHPDLDLSFPDDFAELTQFLGATTIGDEHYDGATFRRWQKDGAPNPPARSRFPRARGPALQPSSRPTAAQIMGRGRISKNTGGSPINQTSLIQLVVSEIDQAPTQPVETLRGSTPNFFEFQLAQDNHELA